LPQPVGVRRVHEGLPIVLFERRGEAFKYSPGLARWLRSDAGTFDVVHIHAVFSHSSLTAGRTCRRLGVPYIVRPLGSLDPWSLEQRAWKKRVLFWMSAKALIAGAAAVHFTTPDEATLAAPMTGRVPAAIVPLGVDDDCLKAQPSVFADRAPLVVALTRLDPKKRLEWLIAAFHDLASTPALSDWRLAIAGDGDPAYRATLEYLAAAGPARGRIEFTGWVSGETKTALLRRAGIFAMPSRQENFGLALAEALALGVPAVVSAGVNLAADVARTGAGIVMDQGRPGLGSALMALMTDPTRREAASRAAATFGRTLTWDAAAGKLIALYASVARSPAGARS